MERVPKRPWSKHCDAKEGRAIEGLVESELSRPYSSDNLFVISIIIYCFSPWYPKFNNPCTQ